MVRAPVRLQEAAGSIPATARCSSERTSLRFCRPALGKALIAPSLVRTFHVVCSLTGKAPHCGCGDCGFDPRRSTHLDFGFWILERKKRRAADVTFILVLDFGLKTMHKETILCF